MGIKIAKNIFYFTYFFWIERKKTKIIFSDKIMEKREYTYVSELIPAGSSCKKSTHKLTVICQKLRTQGRIFAYVFFKYMSVPE